MSTKLFARIKRSSKYYGQGDPNGWFAVEITRDSLTFVVSGGPGGRYRLRDVELASQVRMSQGISLATGKEVSFGLDEPAVKAVAA